MVRKSHLNPNMIPPEGPCKKCKYRVPLERGGGICRKTGTVNYNNIVYDSFGCLYYTPKLKARDKSTARKTKK